MTLFDNGGIEGRIKLSVEVGYEVGSELVVNCLENCKRSNGNKFDRLKEFDMAIGND